MFEKEFTQCRIEARVLFLLFTALIAGCAQSPLQGPFSARSESDARLTSDTSSNIGKNGVDMKMTTTTTLAVHGSKQDLLRSLMLLSGHPELDIPLIERAIGRRFSLEHANAGANIYEAAFDDSPVSLFEVREYLADGRRQSIVMYITLRPSFKFEQIAEGQDSSCLFTQDLSDAMAPWQAREMSVPFRITYHSKELGDRLIFEGTPAHTKGLTRCVNMISVFREF